MRMSGTPLGAIEVSQGKAYTSCSVEMKTADLAPHVLPGAPFYGFETSHRHPLVVFGGGVPVRRNGVVVGAVGVSGGSIEEDVSLAEAVVVPGDAAAVTGAGPATVANWRLPWHCRPPRPVATTR